MSAVGSAIVTDREFTVSAPERTSSRFASIDILRGAVMILMAIDHARVYSGIPAGGPDPAVFFTRWITHFCAPVFVFLAGTSAFLMGRKRPGLSRFLLVRGAWLILLELTVLRLAWTFNFDFAHYEMAGVIWVIGWSMIVLAALVKLPPAVVATIGIVLIGGHNLLDSSFWGIVEGLGDDVRSGVWKILYVGFYAGPIRFGPDGPNLIVLYSLVPWVGVMAAGYAFGKVLTLDRSRRDRICLLIGLGAVALFLLLRGFNIYGDLNPWSFPKPDPENPRPLPAALSFLNTTKYPASLLFLLMTLGPAIAVIPALENARGRWVAVFGRVPFFFYLLHIPLIHGLALVVSQIRFGEVSPWLLANHPMGNPRAPDDYVWSLPLLYLVWATVILILYFPCRWFAEMKSRSRAWWLRYL